jgi:acetyl-CoA carboxylase carboxyl transferase subunit alpha
MLSNTIYSVISPEGCASILWRDAGKADEAAEALKLTAPHLIKINVIDKIIPEPGNGAHEDHEVTAKRLKTALVSGLNELLALDVETLLEQRYQKYRQMGVFSEPPENG